MNIYGLQKLTLLDFPGRVAATVFLAGCNFRCPYCHNSELFDGTAEPVMDDEALLAFLAGRRGLLDGGAFTGGAPLLTPGLDELIRKIRALGYAVKLDTNGAYPARLRALVEAGLLDYAAMDVKDAPSRYARTVGLPAVDLAPLRESVSLLLSDAVDYEFRTTVVAELHDEAAFHEMGAWIRGARRWILQPFTDRDTVRFSGLSAPKSEQLRRYLEIMREYAETAEIRGMEL